MWAAAWLGVRVPTSATLLSIAGNSANSCKYFLSARQASYGSASVCQGLRNIERPSSANGVYLCHFHCHSPSPFTRPFSYLVPRFIKLNRPALLASSVAINDHCNYPSDVSHQHLCH